MSIPGSRVRLHSDVEMLTRDGVKLRADVYASGSRARRPVILVRTAYNKTNSRDHYSIDRLATAGYLVVVQDVRGRFSSDGEYSSYLGNGAQESVDGYDAVEWAAALDQSNGFVGALGSSYDAWLIWKFAALRPPHLRAMFAYSEPASYTDLEGPGSIRPGRRLHWLANSMAPESRRRRGVKGSQTAAAAETEWHSLDRGKWLWFLPWSDLPPYVLGPFYDEVRAWLKDPSKDPWEFDGVYREIDLPNVHITGWYDHCISSLEHYSRMVDEGRSEESRKGQKLIIGPWNHQQMGSRKVGEVDFGPDASLDIPGLALRWFDHYLKGKRNGVDLEPPVRIFTMGTNEWRSEPRWPIGVSDHTLFLTSRGRANTPSGDGRLVSRPSKPETFDAYSYDPRDPVMSLYNEEMYTMPADQRRLAHRDDILVYQTDTLKEDLEVTGSPTAVIFASSSALDTDFFARLIDVYPGGEARDLTMGIIRARYRTSIGTPELLKPGEVTEFKIALGPTSNIFKRGHRVRLDVTSSDFPNFDRNHNSGRKDNLDAALVVANQRVYSGGGYPSRVALPRPRRRSGR